MSRHVARASRQYIEYKLSQGYSPSAILEAHNYLATHRTTEPFPVEQRVYRHRKLSRADLARVYDRWRVHARRHPTSKEGTQRAERRTRIEEKRATYRAKVEDRLGLGLPPPPDPIRAADAGMLYRLTNEQRYREHFEEGSP